MVRLPVTAGTTDLTQGGFAMPTAIPFKKAPVARNAAVQRLLDDPIMDLVLARDGITRADVLQVLDDARRGLRARALDAAA
jgi:hypothetical protein